MFTIVSAYGISKAPASQWGEQNITTMPAAEVYTTFRELYLTLKPNGLDNNITVNFEELRSEYGAQTETLQTLLNTRTEALTAVTKPNYKAERCIFIDARKAGYTINKALPGGAIDSAVSQADKVELQISRPNTDMALFARRCMVSVNGFFHKTQASAKMAFVNNGAASLSSVMKNYVGILSFEKIGDITYQQLTQTDVHPALELSPLKNGIHIDYAGGSLVGKSVLLVIGGYLHFPGEGVFNQIGEKTFSVHPAAIPLVRRYAESKNILDLAAMQEAPESAHDRAIDVDRLYSDDSLMYYMTHPNTFFVVVDTPNLSYVRSELHSLKIPGRMFAYKAPTELLIVGSGKCAEYWSVKEDGIWAVNIDPAYHGTAMFETVSSQSASMSGITADIATFDGYHNQRGHMLDIFADTVVA